MEAFHRLRSIQFDPIAPVGCNHDLVLQARVPGYKIGDWEKLAYKDRLIYDGWDKMASLVPYEGWGVRRYIHTLYREMYEKKIFQDHKDAVEMILKEITERGPMIPKDFEFQQRREDWKGSWHGPSVTKQTLRALWHTGQIMTTDRKRGQHVYDLTERVVPAQFLNEPPLSDDDARLAIMLDRHRAMGLIRPVAAAEIWSYSLLYYHRKELFAELLKRGQIVPVEVEGVKAHATPEFLTLLDQPSLPPRAIIIAPLDQFMWDRKMVNHLFNFEYIWEIYTPEAKRRWGYYVLPILYGDNLVARAEFFARDGILEMREWHSEQFELDSEFWSAMERALSEFMNYSSTKSLRWGAKIDKKVRDRTRSSAKAK